MDSSSVPVHPVTNGHSEERTASGKEWVKFDTNSNDKTSQATQEKEHHAIIHHQSMTGVAVAAQSAGKEVLGTVAVIQPSSSVHVSHDPLSDSLSSPTLLHKLSPISSPLKEAKAGTSGRKNQSNLMNEISSDTSITIPESTTTTTTTATTGAATNSTLRPNSLSTTSKSFSKSCALPAPPCFTDRLRVIVTREWSDNRDTVTTEHIMCVGDGSKVPSRTGARRADASLSHPDGGGVCAGNVHPGP